MVERVASAYGRGPLELLDASFGRNVVLVLRGAGEDFVLKAVRGEAARAHLEWELALLQALRGEAEAQVPPLSRCDRPLLTIDLDQDWTAALYPRLRGRKCTAADGAAIGAALAELHLACDRLERRGEPMLDEHLLIDAPLKALTERWRLSPELLVLVQELRSWLTALPRTPGPFGCCHGDAHSDNALLGPDGLVRFVDFEHGGNTWRAYDLATFVWGTFRDERGAPAWHAFVRSYALGRPLSDQEVSWIRPFLLVRHLWWLGFVARSGAPFDFAGSIELFFRIASETGALDVLRGGS